MELRVRPIGTHPSVIVDEAGLVPRFLRVDRQVLLSIQGQVKIGRDISILSAMYHANIENDAAVWRETFCRKQAILAAGWMRRLRYLDNAHVAAYRGGLFLNLQVRLIGSGNLDRGSPLASPGLGITASGDEVDILRPSLRPVRLSYHLIIDSTLGGWDWKVGVFESELQVDFTIEWVLHATLPLGKIMALEMIGNGILQRDARSGICHPGSSQVVLDCGKVYSNTAERKNTGQPLDHCALYYLAAMWLAGAVWGISISQQVLQEAREVSLALDKDSCRLCHVSRLTRRQTSIEICRRSRETAGQTRRISFVFPPSLWTRREEAGDQAYSWDCTNDRNRKVRRLQCRTAFS